MSSSSVGSLLVLAGVWAASMALGAAPAAPLAALRAAGPEQAIVDSIVHEALAGGRAAGMSVAVAREGRIVAEGAYGSADLELDVPTPPNAVYEIGSVTKHFTAAAVLQLAERGTIDLDADLTAYLPDYPTQGHTVPVHRLLDHTSGIAGYTEIPEFGLLAIRRRMVTGGTLNDGTRLRYGGGLALADARGHPSIGHGGGIPGFLSNLAYLPEEDMTIAVLVNTVGPVTPDEITAQIVEALLGSRPLDQRPFTGEAAAYVGTYEGVGRGGPMQVTVSEGPEGLEIRTGSGEPQPLVRLGDGSFARGSARFTFEEEGDRFVRLRADLVGNYTILQRTR